MNDQLLSDLRAAGFDVRPTATLDKDGAFFALTEDQLIHLDAGGAASVQLRDVTRIHSDQAGILRVETGDTTAVTAPLLGYEPARVQHFFGEVRHATARAKSLPPSPLPTAPGESSSPWKTGWSGANPAASSVTVLRPGDTERSDAEPSDAASTASAPEPERPEPERSEAERAEPARMEPIHAEAPAAEPEAAPTEAGRAEAPAPPPAPAEPVRISSAPTPMSISAPASTPLPASAPRRETAPSPLGRFAPTLRFLAVLMGLTGIGVGALTWLAGAPLSGLWLVGVGAVGAFALYVFAEVVRAVADIQGRLSDDG